MNIWIGITKLYFNSNFYNINKTTIQHNKQMPYINFINKIYIGHLLVVLDGGFINILTFTQRYGEHKKFCKKSNFYISYFISVCTPHFIPILLFLMYYTSKAQYSLHL